MSLYGKINQTLKENFNLDQIKSMYPDVQYYVKNSNGGTLAGKVDLDEAKAYADKERAGYVKDKLYKDIDVFVVDREGKKLYTA